MRSRSNLLVLLGIAFFIVGGAIVYLLADDGESSVDGDDLEVTAVVATEDVSPGDLADDLIETGKLKEIEVKAGQLQPGVVARLAQLRGAEFVQGFAKDQPITTSGLQLESRTFEVPEGYEAVAVQIDFVAGGAGYVDAGDRINLYGVFRTAAGQAATPRAELLLTNVEVLDVNLNIPARRGTAGDQGAGEVARPAGDNITYLLALRTDDVEKVVFATELESLYATLTAPDAPPAGPTPGRDPATVLAEEPDAAFRS